MQEGERLAGAPIVFRDAPYVFDEEDRLMFIQVGKQLSQALVNTRIHEKVRVEAITDGLTGAYNRRYLDDFLNIEVKRSQRYQRPMSILLLDMDYFHACNEKAGHQAGDSALRDVVQLLNLGVRSVDPCCPLRRRGVHGGAAGNGSGKAPWKWPNVSAA